MRNIARTEIISPPGVIHHEHRVLHGVRETRVGLECVVGRRRLRSDEPPNPTPSRVRETRRRGELMVAAATGVSPVDLAVRFGFATGVGALRAVGRARDRVFPVDIAESIAVESQVRSVLSDSVMRVFRPGVDDARMLRASGVILGGTDLFVRLRDAELAAQRALLDSDWVDLATAELGVWTEALTMRADDCSFHEIAEQFGFTDFFHANKLVATDLVRFEQGCARQLRRAQVATLTGELQGVWAPATSWPEGSLQAGARAMSILGRRFDVRGIGLPFPGPLIVHSPTVHR